MQNLYDYKRFAVLYVDDEEKSLKYFTRAFEDQFHILSLIHISIVLKKIDKLLIILEILERIDSSVGVVTSVSQMEITDYEFSLFHPAVG